MSAHLPVQHLVRHSSVPRRHSPKCLSASLGLVCFQGESVRVDKVLLSLSMTGQQTIKDADTTNTDLWTPYGHANLYRRPIDGRWSPKLSTGWGKEKLKGAKDGEKGQKKDGCIQTLGKPSEPIRRDISAMNQSIIRSILSLSLSLSLPLFCMTISLIFSVQVRFFCNITCHKWANSSPATQYPGCINTTGVYVSYVMFQL